MTSQKDATIEFTRQELVIIWNTLQKMTSVSLNKWLELIPKEGEPFSAKCNAQWRITNIYSQILHKAGIALEIEQEITDEEVQKILKEYGFSQNQ